MIMLNSNQEFESIGCDCGYPQTPSILSSRRYTPDHLAGDINMNENSSDMIVNMDTVVSENSTIQDYQPSSPPGSHEDCNSNSLLRNCPDSYNLPERLVAAYSGSCGNILDKGVFDKFNDSIAENLNFSGFDFRDSESVNRENDYSCESRDSFSSKCSYQSTPLSNSQDLKHRGTSKRKSFGSRKSSLNEISLYTAKKPDMKLFRTFSDLPPKELWRSPQKKKQMNTTVNDFVGFEHLEPEFKVKIKRLKKLRFYYKHYRYELPPLPNQGSFPEKSSNAVNVANGTDSSHRPTRKIKKKRHFDEMFEYDSDSSAEMPSVKKSRNLNKMNKAFESAVYSFSSFDSKTSGSTMGNTSKSTKELVTQISDQYDSSCGNVSYSQYAKNSKLFGSQRLKQVPIKFKNPENIISALSIPSVDIQYSCPVARSQYVKAKNTKLVELQSSLEKQNLREIMRKQEELERKIKPKKTSAKVKASLPNKRLIVRVKKLSVCSLTDEFVAKHGINPRCISQLCLDLMDDFRIDTECSSENDLGSVSTSANDSFNPVITGVTTVDEDFIADVKNTSVPINQPSIVSVVRDSEPPPVSLHNNSKLIPVPPSIDCDSAVLPFDSGIKSTCVFVDSNEESPSLINTCTSVPPALVKDGNLSAKAVDINCSSFHPLRRSTLSKECNTEEPSEDIEIPESSLEETLPFDDGNWSSPTKSCYENPERCSPLTESSPENDASMAIDTPSSQKNDETTTNSIKSSLENDCSTKTPSKSSLKNNGSTTPNKSSVENSGGHLKTNSKQASVPVLSHEKSPVKSGSEQNSLLSRVKALRAVRKTNDDENVITIDDEEEDDDEDLKVDYEKVVRKNNSSWQITLAVPPVLGQTPFADIIKDYAIIKLNGQSEEEFNVHNLLSNSDLNGKVYLVKKTCLPSETSVNEQNGSEKNINNSDNVVNFRTVNAAINDDENDDGVQFLSQKSVIKPSSRLSNGNLIRKTTGLQVSQSTLCSIAPFANPSNVRNVSVPLVEASHDRSKEQNETTQTQITSKTKEPQARKATDVAAPNNTSSPDAL